MAGFFEEGMDVIYSEGDLELTRDFLSANLKTIEVLLQRDPDNRKMNFLAGQAFGSYAMAFLDDIQPERAAAFYKRALTYSHMALPKNKSFEINIKPAELEKVLAEYTEDEVAELFWMGFNWGSGLLLDIEKPSSLVQLAKVEMVMKRCLELDETYFFGGVHLFYGVFYCARPPILGGKPEEGAKHFDKQAEITDNKVSFYKYLKARYYAIQVNDEELFDRLIDELIHLDIDQYPEVRFMNSMSKWKAEQLKLHKEDYFF